MSTRDFAALALIGEFQSSSEDTLKRSLDTPGAPGTVPVGTVRNISKARIASAMAELAHGEIDNVRQWLRQVAATRPDRALELFLQLAEFSIPKLKAVAVQVDDISDPNRAKAMSVEELQRIVSTQ